MRRRHRQPASAAPDPTSPLVPSGNLRRRQIVSMLAESGATLAAALAVGVLAVLVGSVAVRGGGALSFAFLTKAPPLFGGPGGGIAPAIVGSAMIVGVGAAIAVPVGVLAAIFLTEFARPRAAATIRLALDLLYGLPTVIVGLFVFVLLVVGHHQSGFAGAFALSIIMMPLIARSSEEMLLLVPGDLREAAEALGVSRWRATLGVVLPSALGGMVTGTILAVARAAGETAPLIFTCSIAPNGALLDLFGHALSSIPVSIFTLSEQADPSGYQRAWGAALVLLAGILITNIAARAALARSRRTMSR